MQTLPRQTGEIKDYQDPGEFFDAVLRYNGKTGEIGVANKLTADKVLEQIDSEQDSSVVPPSVDTEELKPMAANPAFEYDDALSEQEKKYKQTKAEEGTVSAPEPAIEVRTPEAETSEQRLKELLEQHNKICTAIKQLEEDVKNSGEASHVPEDAIRQITSGDVWNDPRTSKPILKRMVADFVANIKGSEQFRGKVEELETKRAERNDIQSQTEAQIKSILSKEADHAKVDAIISLITNTIIDEKFGHELANLGLMKSFELRKQSRENATEVDPVDTKDGNGAAPLISEPLTPGNDPVDLEKAGKQDFAEMIQIDSNGEVISREESKHEEVDLPSDKIDLSQGVLTDLENAKPADPANVISQIKDRIGQTNVANASMENAGGKGKGEEESLVDREGTSIPIKLTDDYAKDIPEQGQPQAEKPIHATEPLETAGSSETKVTSPPASGQNIQAWETAEKTLVPQAVAPIEPLTPQLKPGETDEPKAKKSRNPLHWLFERMAKKNEDVSADEIGKIEQGIMAERVETEGAEKEA